MPASQEEIFEAEDEGVQIHCGWGPKEICTEDGKVTGIVLKNAFPCLTLRAVSARFMTRRIP